NAPIAFRPIEPNVPRSIFFESLSCAIEEDRRGIGITGRRYEYSSAALRKTKFSRIQNPICPPISQDLKLLHDLSNGFPALQKHGERDILEQDVLRSAARRLQDLEDIHDEI